MHVMLTAKKQAFIANLSDPKRNICRWRLRSARKKLSRCGGVGGGGDRGASALPKVWICRKSFKIWAKSMKMFAKYPKFWANCLNLRIKMTPSVVWFWKIDAQRRENRMKTSFWKSRASLGKKSFAPPKICLLLHLSGCGGGHSKEEPLNHGSLTWGSWMWLEGLIGFVLNISKGIMGFAHISITATMILQKSVATSLLAGPVTFIGMYSTRCS